MKKILIIIGSAAAIGGGVFLVYKLLIPPKLYIPTLDVTGVGNFVWGISSGPLKDGQLIDAGWGWGGVFVKTGSQWVLQVSKNGKSHSSIKIVSAQIYNV